MMVEATALKVGDRVLDDFTPWAEVVSIRSVRSKSKEPGVIGVLIEWRLADGRREVSHYAKRDRFTLVSKEDER